MIRRHAALAFACCVVSLAGFAAGNSTAPLQARVDGMFKPWTQGNVPGCAVGIAQRGKWLAKGGYGAASLEARTRITPRTVFYTGSVSKQFTSAAVLRLVDAGTVRLGDDVRKYVPELPVYDPPITLDHLIHQASGLVDYFVMLGDTWGDRHSSDEVLAMIAATKPMFRAGQSHSYSNSNHFLLARVVERASGKPFKEFAREALFEPLGMTDTRFHDDEAEVVPRYASGYHQDGRDKYVVVKTHYTQVGAGGLLTTIDDLGKWVRVYEDPNALPGSPDFGARLQQAGTLSGGSSNDYAFGLQLATEQGVRVATHGGFFPGYKASFTWLPDTHKAVFVLCNFSQAPIELLRQQLITQALQDGR